MAALESPSFTATVAVPPQFAWARMMSDTLQKTFPSDAENNQLYMQYGHLLRIHSWTEGIDWVPHKNIVTVAVPNNIVTFEKRSDDGLLTDGLSAILYGIIKKVSVEYLLEHFK